MKKGPKVSLTELQNKSAEIWATTVSWIIKILLLELKTTGQRRYQKNGGETLQIRGCKIWLVEPKRSCEWCWEFDLLCTFKNDIYIYIYLQKFALSRFSVLSTDKCSTQDTVYTSILLPVWILGIIQSSSFGCSYSGSPQWIIHPVWQRFSTRCPSWHNPANLWGLGTSTQTALNCARTIPTYGQFRVDWTVGGTQSTQKKPHRGTERKCKLHTKRHPGRPGEWTKGTICEAA